MAKMSKRGPGAKTLPKARKSAMSQAKKMAGSVAKPKSKTQRSVERAASGIVTKAFRGVPASPVRSEAMRKTGKILETRMMTERGRSATRQRAEVAKSKRQSIAGARRAAKRAITGR